MFNQIHDHDNLYKLRIQNQHMLGYAAMLLILHTAFSTRRWRQYTQANQEPFFLPLDIILELVLAVVLAFNAILSQTRRFKLAKEFTQAKSYDSSFYRPNFRNLRTSRANLLLPSLKQRLSTDTFDLSIRL